MRCQLIAKQAMVAKIDPITSKAINKYKTSPKLDDTLDYVVLTVIPSPSSTQYKHIRTKIFKFTLLSILQICPDIRTNKLLERDNKYDLSKLIRELCRLLRYDNTSNAGIRLRFHGIHDEVTHAGVSIITAPWPHEIDNQKQSRATNIQTAFRGFRIRRNKKRMALAKAKHHAAAVDVSIASF